MRPCRALRQWWNPGADSVRTGTGRRLEPYCLPCSQGYLDRGLVFLQDTRTAAGEARLASGGAVLETGVVGQGVLRSSQGLGHIVDRSLSGTCGC
jgi:hypothetical protein